jgi:hypothetical protein
MLRSAARRDGGVEYTLALSRAQARVIGPDGALLLRHLDTLLLGLAALRSGVWNQDGATEHEPSVWDWAAVIDAAAVLGELGQAVTAAAVREHAELGGTTEQLGDAMGRPPGTAQNRRQKWIGTKAEPIAPAGPELWARRGGHPPAS